MTNSHHTPRFALPSITRASDLAAAPFDIAPVPQADWANGQFVALEVGGVDGPRSYDLELSDGRLAQVYPGDHLIGALGRRAATLQCVGTWEAVERPEDMDLLSIAGVIGKSTSWSAFTSAPAPVRYLGHVQRQGTVLSMADFAPHTAPSRSLATRVLLIIGTSMDAGKTTAAVRIIRTLTARGLGVAGVKLTGVGRYRDILAMGDAGAEWILDFVDGGIPSTVVPPDEFRRVASSLMGKVDELGADVIVLEAGASPLEPYNGDIAVEVLGTAIRAVVLCASDPYSAVGVLQAFGLEPTFVAGRATCTDAGMELTASLTGRPALNLLDPTQWPRLEAILAESLGLSGAPPSRFEDVGTTD